MRRQALEVTIRELRVLADKLENEAADTFPLKEMTGTTIQLKFWEIQDKKFLVPIVNKTKDESDMWKLEGVKK